MFRVLLLASAVFCLAGCEVVGLVPESPEPEPASRPWTEMLDAVNAARSEARTCGGERFGAAPPLAWSARLEAAALRHSRDMARTDRLSHRGSDGSRVGARATEAGYDWRRIGENVAQGPGSVEAAVAGWLASPSHCGGIMDPGYTQVGAAKVDRFWTLVSARPHR